MSKYKAFISYNHSDVQLATALKRGLEKFNRTWYRLRRFTVFQDRSNLTTTPSAWADISVALDASEYLLLIASPQSAASEWVSKEVAYWLKQDGENRLLIVLVDGVIEWSDALSGFDWDRTTALPEALRGEFADEPLYSDMRLLKPEELSLRNDDFRDCIADISARLRGVSKETVIGDHLRARSQLLRAVSCVALVLLVLLACLGVQTWREVYQRNVANQQRQRAEWALSDSYLDQAIQMSLGQGDSDRLYRAGPTLDRQGQFGRSLAFAAAALRVRPDNESAAQFLGNTLLQHSWLLPWGPSLRHGNYVADCAISPDGKLLATGADDRFARLWSLPSGTATGLTLEHPGPVMGVAFSPTGDRLLTIAADSGSTVDVLRYRALDDFLQGRQVAKGTPNKLYLWDLASGKLIGHQAFRSEVKRAAMAADGSVTVVLYNGSISQWQPDGDKEPTNWRAPLDWLPGPPRTLINAAISPNARHAFACNGTTPLMPPCASVLWTIGEAVPQRQSLNRGGYGVVASGFSPDASRLATGGIHGGLRVWDGESGRLVKVLREPTKPSLFQVLPNNDVEYTAGVRFSPDASRLVTTGSKGSLEVWDLDKGTSQRVLSTRFVFRQARFDPQGEFIVATTWNGALLAIDASTLELAAKPLPHASTITSLAHSPDGKLLVTSSAQGKIQVWESTPAGSSRLRFEHPAGLAEGRFDHAGERVATACQDGQVRVWDARSGKLLADLQHGKSVTSVDFHPGGNQLLSLSEHQAKVWDLNDSAAAAQVLRSSGGLAELMGSIMHPMMPASQIVFRGRYTADGKTILSNNASLQGAVWHAQTGTQIGRAIGGPTANHGVRGVRMSPDGQYLLSYANEWNARVWKLEDNRWVQQGEANHHWPVTGAAFHPTESVVLTCSLDKTAGLWSVPELSPIGQRISHPDPVLHVAFDPAGSKFVTCSLEGTILVREFPSGNLAAPPFGHDNWVVDMAFDPQGRFLATACQEGLVEIWDTESGRLAAPPIVNQGPVASITFGPRGRRLLYASADGFATLYDFVRFQQPPSRHAAQLLIDVAEHIGGFTVNRAGILEPAARARLNQLRQRADTLSNSEAKRVVNHVVNGSRTP